MERTQAAGRPATARLLAVCAVLLGLFLMHGAPSSAAGGCHAAMSAAMQTAPAAPAPKVQKAPKAVSAAPGMPAASVVQGGHATRLGPAGLDGTLCVSTPAYGPVTLGAAGLVAVVAVTGWALTGRRIGAGGVSWRGPPTGGRSLLLRVCVART